MFWIFAGKQKEAQRLDGTMNAPGVVEVAPVFVEEQVMTVIRMSWGCLPLHRRECLHSPHFRLPHTKGWYGSNHLTPSLSREKQTSTVGPGTHVFLGQSSGIWRWRGINIAFCYSTNRDFTIKMSDAWQVCLAGWIILLKGGSQKAKSALIRLWRNGLTYGDVFNKTKWKKALCIP